MPKKKCEKDIEKETKLTHKYLCKCGYSSKNKEKLCKPKKIKSAG